jgi:APA family basic amino acid/polyamine antiporter
MNNAPSTQLPRVLNTTHAASIVVGIIIGSGIFLVPREMMAAVGSGTTVYAVWIIGGLLSLFGAMSYAELAAMKPRTGGEYAFLLDAYGPLTAFLYSWTWTLIAKPATIASYSMALIRVLGTFHTFAFFTHIAFLQITFGQLFAILATCLISLLNIVSTRESANVQTALTILKIIMVMAIAAICLTSVQHGSLQNFGTHFTGARGGFSGFMIALTAALWAYDGWSDVTQMAGEVRNPQRALPLALVGGVATVGALYMLTNAALQYVMPAATIAVSERPAADALLLILGHIGAAIVSIGIAISVCASFVGSSLSGARVGFAAARDRLFPASLAAIHPRFQTPANALVLQAFLSVLLILAVGTFQSLFSLTIFSEWGFYALVTATVFVFRRREPATPRPYRVHGYPIVPALFILAAVVLLVFSFTDQPTSSTIGTIIILCGIPAHFLYQRSQRRPADPAHTI